MEQYFICCFFLIEYYSYLFATFKLVLQLAVRALRAVYGQILKILYGTRTLHARHTHVARTSHARVYVRRLPVRARRRRRACKCFAAGALRSKYSRQSEGSTHGARTGHVRVPHLNDWKATCSVALLWSDNCLKAAGPVRATARTAGCKTSLTKLFW